MSENIEFAQASLELQEAVAGRISEAASGDQELWRLLPPCLYYPEGAFGRSDGEQRAFIQECCNECLYTSECLVLGMTALGLRDGVYGGKTRNERLQLKKQRG